MRERRGRSTDQPPAAHLQRGDRPVGLVGSQAVALNTRSSRDALDRIVRAAVRAVEPQRLLERSIHAHQRELISRPLFVVAAGKAAWPMTAGVIASGMPLEAGLVAGPRVGGADLPPAFEWMPGAHPAPDATSVAAATRAMELARESRGGILVVLLSGGASSMLALPDTGVSLQDKIATGDALMRAGAAIHELNCVRKHLSAIKGGRLAAAAAASITFAISDVHAPVEDDPAVIGSGPTVADPTTFADALHVVEDVYADASVPAAVRRHLERGAQGRISESPKPGDPGLDGARYHVVANRRTAVSAAADAARAYGFSVHVMDEPTRGEARVAGSRFAEEGLALASGRKGVCVLASGETTVRVTGRGRGGRNQEFVLGAAPRLSQAAGRALVASVGTDGIDGPTDAAGAIVDETTVTRANRAGGSIDAALRDNDAYPLLDRLGDLVKCGPTGTNVGDLHVLLIA